MSTPVRGGCRRLRLGALAALCALSLPAAAPAAPSIVNPLPAHRSSTVETAPSISADLIDPAGIDPGSVVVRVEGLDVTTSATLEPIADGYRLSYLPLVGFAAGAEVDAYTVAFAIVVMAIEAIVMRPLDAYVSRGRA